MFPLKSDLGLKRRGRQHGVKNDSQSLPSPYQAVVGAAPAAPLHPVAARPANASLPCWPPAAWHCHRAHGAGKLRGPSFLFLHQKLSFSLLKRGLVASVSGVSSLVSHGSRYDCVTLSLRAPWSLGTISGPLGEGRFQRP